MVGVGIVELATGAIGMGTTLAAAVMALGCFDLAGAIIFRRAGARRSAALKAPTEPREPANTKRVVPRLALALGIAFVAGGGGAFASSRDVGASVGLGLLAGLVFLLVHFVDRLVFRRR